MTVPFDVDTTTPASRPAAQLRPPGHEKETIAFIRRFPIIQGQKPGAWREFAILRDETAPPWLARFDERGDTLELFPASGAQFRQQMQQWLDRPG